MSSHDEPSESVIVTLPILLLQLSAGQEKQMRQKAKVGDRMDHKV
jgi:hypothetical protein